MQPTRTLPENYVPAWSLDLRHNTFLNIVLQILNLVFIALAGWMFGLWLYWTRPDVVGAFKLFEISSGGNSLMSAIIWLGLLLLIMVVVLVLHELVHGLFFWLFSGSQPQFGISIGYAFAAMPGWYFPRGQYLLVGLSPLLVLTGLGMALGLILPSAWLAPLLVGVAINAGGAVGDLYVCWRIVTSPAEVLIRDSGDGFQVYIPGG